MLQPPSDAELVRRAQAGEATALGGTVGLGTALYAFGIGPLLHVLLPPLTVGGAAGARRPRLSPAPAGPS